MDMKYLTVLLPFFVFSINSWAQTADSIATGRPGQAIGGRVVGAGILQIQSGYDHNTSEIGSSKSTSQTLNNIVRLGVSESFEFSTIVDYNFTKNTSPGAENSFEGLSQWQLGFRYNIIPPVESWMPILGIQTRFRMKQTSARYSPNQIAPVTILSAQKGLSEMFSLTVNGGISYNGNDNIPTYSYVFSLSQSLTSCLGLAYEVYGNEYNDMDRNYIGLGLAWSLSKDLQLDTYVSTGKNQGIEEVYATAGVSWRTWIF